MIGVIFKNLIPIQVVSELRKKKIQEKLFAWLLNFWGSYDCKFFIYSNIYGKSMNQKKKKKKKHANIIKVRIIENNFYAEDSRFLLLISRI